MAEQGLKDKTVKGVAWSAADNVSQYAVSFLISIVLARLLSPEDYGLLGIIAIFTAICNTLVGGGFSSALIRKKTVSDDDYSTVFIVNLGMSLFLYVIIFFSAPQIATFFNREELVELTRVSSLSIIISALAIVQYVRLTKKLDFKTQTKITMISTTGSGIVGIIMAVCGCGVWSLVVQGLLSHILRTGLLWLFNRWFPQFRFSVSSFKNLFGFGWKMMVSMLLDTTWKEIYQLVVGKFYSPGTLGQYTRAKQLSQMFSSNLTLVIERVTYPVLSEIQDNKQRMVLAYRRIIKTTMFITATTMFFVGAISEPLIYCLFGNQWREAAMYLPIICIGGSLYPLHSINLNMLQVQGRSDLFLILEIIKKTISLGPLFVGAFVGILPMLYTSIAVSCISFFINSFFSGRMIKYSSWMQIKDVAPSYCIAIIVALSVWFLKYLPFSYWLILPLQVLVGVITFWIICKVSRIQEFEEVKQIVIPLIKKIRNK